MLARGARSAFCSESRTFSVFLELLTLARGASSEVCSEPAGFSMIQDAPAWSIVRILPEIDRPASGRGASGRSCVQCPQNFARSESATLSMSTAPPRSLRKAPSEFCLEATTVSVFAARLDALAWSAKLLSDNLLSVRGVSGRSFPKASTGWLDV